MSWAGFVKSVNRAGTTFMQRTGQVDKTIDREFSDVDERYKSMEAKMEQLNKDARGYLDALRALSNSQMHIADTVSQFLDNSRDVELGASAARYKSLMAEVDQQVRADVDAQCMETVLEPISRYCALFPEVNEAIRKRNNKLTDYDAARAKVRKLTEKPSDDPARLPRAETQMRQAQEIYEALNSQLVAELPKLVDLRVPYLDPSFEALVKLQYRFSSESHARLETLRPPSQRDDNDLAQVLQEMRELSICALN